MKQEDRKRMEALEMWIRRKCENISWRDKISNDEVLRRINEERGLLQSITRRKTTWIDNILRGDGLLKDALEGRMEGKRVQGRPRKQMLDDVKDSGYQLLKENASNK